MESQLLFRNLHCSIFFASLNCVCAPAGFACAPVCGRVRVCGVCVLRQGTSISTEQASLRFQSVQGKGKHLGDFGLCLHAVVSAHKEVGIALVLALWAAEQDLRLRHRHQLSNSTSGHVHEHRLQRREKKGGVEECEGVNNVSPCHTYTLDDTHGSTYWSTPLQSRATDTPPQAQPPTLTSIPQPRR